MSLSLLTLSVSAYAQPTQPPSETPPQQTPVLPPPSQVQGQVQAQPQPQQTPNTQPSQLLPAPQNQTITSQGLLGNTSADPATNPLAAANDPEAVARAQRRAFWSARLRILNGSLPGIAARSRSSRITNGVIQLAVGTGVGVLGFFAAPGSGGGATDLRPWFFTFAGVSIVTGVLDLAWAPARERLTEQFDQMPMTSARERRARVRFGEHALDEMAADGQRRRILSAVGSSTVSLGMLALVYREPLFNNTPYTFTANDAIVIGLTGVNVVMSLLQLFQRSEEERLRESYQTQMRTIRAELGMPQ